MATKAATWTGLSLSAGALVCAAACAPAAGRTPPPAPGTVACVSLSTRQAWLLRDGQVVTGPVRIMPGGPAEPTPVGVFHVAWKDREHRSSEFGHEPMPNAVFFAAGGIAFHAGPLDSSSHGCVHLSDADSATFFDALAVGARVQVVA